MKTIYIPLTPKAAQALAVVASRNRRHPKHQAALIIERWLARRGYLDDPTGGGQPVGRGSGNRARGEFGD